MWADTLVENGFEQCRADPCIFRKIVDGVVVLIVGVYADDLQVGGSEEECDLLLASLNKKSPANDLGECTWYDGCCIERDEELGTILSHKKHTSRAWCNGLTYKRPPPSQLPPVLI